MKKLLLLGAAALLGFGSGHADTFYTEGSKVASAADLTTGKYLLVATSSGDEKVVRFRDNQNLTSIFSEYAYLSNVAFDGDYIWDITVTGEGDDKTFSIKPAYHDCYFSKIGTHSPDAQGNLKNTTAEAEIAQYKLVEISPEALSDGTFQTPGTRFNIQITNNVHSDGNITYLHTNHDSDRHLSYWSGNGSPFTGTCVAMMFVKLTETTNLANVTYNWPDLNGGQVTATYELTNGVANIPAFDGFTRTSGDSFAIAADATAATVSVAGTWANWIQKPMNTPFFMTCNGQKHMIFTHTKNQDKTIDLSQDRVPNLEPERIWYFKNAGFDVEAGVQKVTLHNMATGDNKGVQVNAGNQSNPAITKNPTILSLAQNTSNNNGFSLRVGLTGNGYFNDLANARGLRVWNPGTNASKNGSGSLMTLQTLVASDLEGMTGYHVDGVGDFHYDTEKKAAAIANPTVANIREMVQWLNEAEFADYFTDARYYRMRFDRQANHSFSVSEGAATAGETNLPLSDEDADRIIRGIESSTSDANQIWQIVPKEGTTHFQVVSPNAHGYYMGYRTDNGDGLHVTKTSRFGAEFILSYDIGEHAWLFNFNGTQAYLSNIYGGGVNIGRYTNGYNDDGNKVIVTLAETIDYTIPEGAEYGAVCYPFGIVLPDGVTAYIATAVNTTDEGSTLRLVQVPGNTIPANTAVLIKQAEAGTIQLAISDHEPFASAKQLFGRNILSGTLIKTKGFTAGDHYLLDSDATKMVKDENELVAANTAYLSASVPNAGADEIILGEPVENPSYNVTFHFPAINGRAVADQIIHAVPEATKIGTLYDLAKEELPHEFTFVTTEEQDNAEVHAEMTINATGKWAYPAIEFGRAYRLGVRNNSVSGCKNFKLKDNGEIDTRNATNADDLVPERLFYFKEAEGSTPDALKVTVHSVTLGDSKGLTLARNAEGKIANKTKAIFTDTPDYFDLVGSENTDPVYHDFFAFALKVTAPALNDNGNEVTAGGHLNDVEGTLGAWNNGNTSRDDIGSAIKFFDIADSEIEGIGASEELTANVKETMSAADFMAAFTDAATTLAATYETATGIPAEVGESAALPGFVSTSNANAIALAALLNSEAPIGANYSAIKAEATALASAATSLDVKEGTLMILKSTDFNRRGYLCNDGGILRGTGSMNLTNPEPTDDYKFAFVMVDGKKYVYNLGGDSFMNAFGDKSDTSWGDSRKAADFTWRLNEVATPFNDMVTFSNTIAHSVTFSAGRAPSDNSAFTGVHEGGLTIITDCTRSALVTMGGVNRADGNGLIASYAGQLTEDELGALRARISAAHADVADAHGVVADYIGSRSEAHNTTPGHFNEAAYSAFANVMAQADDESEHSHHHYLMAQAHQAAQTAEGAAINEFEHNGVYNLYENDEPLAAKIVWVDEQATHFYLEVGPYVAGQDAATAINWLCTVNENNEVVFTHNFAVNAGAVRSDAAAAGNKVRARAQEETRLEPVNLTEAATPTYDGMGNITLGDKKLTSSVALQDAETTGISELTADRNAAGEIYDLQGRRVSKAGRGLYLVNGRKQLCR